MANTPNIPNIGDGFKNIFLAGVGALALGAEKTQELVSNLVKQGEITVEQGKALNEEILQSAGERVDTLRDDIIQARINAMTKDERDAFAAKIAEMAVAANERDAALGEEAEEVTILEGEEDTKNTADQN